MAKINVQDAEKKANEELQQKYMYFQMLQQQISKLSQQMEAFYQQLAELQDSQQSVKEMETPSEAETYVPLSGGIFVKAALKNDGNLLVNVGSSVVVEKSCQEGWDLLQDKLLQVEANLTEANRVMEALTSQATAVLQDLQAHQAVQ